MRRLIVGLMFLGTFCAVGAPVDAQEVAQPIWTNASGSFGFSFGRVGWRQRSTPPEPPTTLDIEFKDASQLLCEIKEVVGPARPQETLSSNMFAAQKSFVVGSVEKDGLGGSKITKSDLSMAGKIAVHRRDYETLDVTRPISRQAVVWFGVDEGQSARIVQISCVAGQSVPKERWSEIDTLLGSLQIRGITPVPVR